MLTTVAVATYQSPGTPADFLVSPSRDDVDVCGAIMYKQCNYDNYNYLHPGAVAHSHSVAAMTVSSCSCGVSDCDIAPSCAPEGDRKGHCAAVRSRPGEVSRVRGDVAFDF